jgi:hypothetical protein
MRFLCRYAGTQHPFVIGFPLRSRHPDWLAMHTSEALSQA